MDEANDLGQLPWTANASQKLHASEHDTVVSIHTPMTTFFNARARIECVYVFMSAPMREFDTTREHSMYSSYDGNTTETTKKECRRYAQENVYTLTNTRFYNRKTINSLDVI